MPLSRLRLCGRTSGTNPIGRALHVAIATAGLALGLGVALPAAIGAQDAEFASVAESYAAGVGLDSCTEIFLPLAPVPPTVDDGDEDDEFGAGFDPANLLPTFFVVAEE